MFINRHAWLAVGLLAGIHASASAAVSIYGNLDLGLVKESGASARVNRGYNNWIGLRGDEPLSSGLSVVFNLQTRFNPDTGEQERRHTFWQGESTVGLKSSSAGTLRIGRALSPLWQGVWAFEPWQNSGFNASLSAYQTGSYSSDGVNDAALDYANFSRISNGVFYTSPQFSGLTADIAAGVERSENADARVTGASLNYAGGPVSAMFSWESNARRDRIAFLGLSYRFGAATAMGSYTRGRLVDAGKERSFVLASTYEIGANTLRVGYGRNPSIDTDKFSVGVLHALSSRTGLYVDVYREKVDTSRNGMAVGINHAF